MRWYEGDIAQAVSMSKRKNAIFVVYVEGKDDKSTNLTSLLDSSDVSTKLESNNFVAIKVEAGSVSHNQFAAIYKNVQVPSLFFIGKNGKPIDIIIESTSANDLSTRINSVIETHSGVSTSSSDSQIAPSTAPKLTLTVSQNDLSSSESSVRPASTSSDHSTRTKLSTDFIKSEQDIDIAATSTPVTEEKPATVNNENGICFDVKEDTPSSTSIETNEFLEQEKQELSKEEKIERAKELVEIKRETKKKEEEEAARQKELERRKSGQDVQKLRRWQQDQELKNLMEERQRAKNEEKAARDRILAQIAQDKADRAARFGTSPPSAAPVQADVIQRPSTAPSANSTAVRLQFKLPDGSSKTQNFDSSNTLADVRAYVAQNLNLPFKNFSLSTTFPRREFAPDDLDSTLRDLELCPTAVILVLPIASASAVVSSQDGGFMSLIWFLLSPILGVFGYFRNMIFGESSAPQPPERNKRNNEDVLNQNQQPAKRKATDSSVVRRQGSSNIHRLTDRTDSDEDNNTWNGNSTQQM